VISVRDFKKYKDEERSLVFFSNLFAIEVDSVPNVVASTARH